MLSKITALEIKYLYLQISNVQLHLLICDFVFTLQIGTYIGFEFQSS